MLSRAEKNPAPWNGLCDKDLDGASLLHRQYFLVDSCPTRRASVSDETSCTFTGMKLSPLDAQSSCQSPIFRACDTQVFIAEQVLYTRPDLHKHVRTGDLEGPMAESGFKGHPDCR